MKIKIRFLFLAILVVLLIVGVFYKYSEYKLLNNTATLYNESWAQELSMVEDNTKYYDDILVLTEEFESVSNIEDFLNTIDKIQALFSILENRVDDYLVKISDNESKYRGLKNKSWYLFGSNAGKGKEILQKQLDYYELEKEGAFNSLAMIYFFQNFYQALGDNLKLSNFFTKIATNTQQNAQTYFSDIASLVRYESGDFRFIREDEIKKYYPEEYQILNRYKNYFASNYSLIKQYNAGQIDSSTYRESYNRMLQDSAELNVDFDGLFRSSEEGSRERISGIIILISEQIRQISLLNEAQHSYPFVSGVPQIDFYPVQCQLYNYKANSLFPNVVKRPVESENIEDLITELNSISPKTDFIDGYFDSTLMEFENTEDKIRFACKGKYSDSRYEFVIPK